MRGQAGEVQLDFQSVQLLHIGFLIGQLTRISASQPFVAKRDHSEVGPLHTCGFAHREQWLAALATLVAAEGGSG